MSKTSETPTDSEKSGRKELEGLEWRYYLVKKDLEKEKRKEKYQEVFSVCYLILTNQKFLGSFEGLDEVSEYFEAAVLEYFEDAENEDRFEYLIDYYTNDDILKSIEDLSLRRKHLTKALKYFELWANTFPDDGAVAESYVNCYFKLYYACQKEDYLEQANYVEKAHKLARKYALQFKSERMIEVLRNATEILELCRTNQEDWFKSMRRGEV